MVTDIAQIDRICIYFPAEVDRASIEDCAPFLAKGEFAQGIFNEVLATTAPVPGGARCVVLLDQNSSIFCRVHQFGINGGVIDPSELDVSPQHGGTVLSITRAAVDEACLNTTPAVRSYFRLRFHLNRGSDQNPFVKVVPTPDRLLQSGFDEIEYLDFRVNEARTLPMPIELRMKTDRAAGGAVLLKLVAFLTAVPVHSELTVSNTPSHKMRLLEHRLWNSYAAGIPDGMVVYHWKREHDPNRPIADFSAFVKLETRRSSRKILAKYLVIAFLIGLLGNFIASGLQWVVGVAWEHHQARTTKQDKIIASPPSAPPPRLPAPTEVGNRL
ncbi:hypothetical protein E5A73_04855 [Sphingomonas gei]|uniref:Uncharacterized protein n=1 Tax=Sphingomonas gei TaxID=1395960 RepID=A0A4S1XFW0_9SPHN|nr:hypothetical protein [Sphingomonas gei]TGX54787.1 hypothetical protein E5A73_04855 [Sphingomonas gei]